MDRILIADPSQNLRRMLRALLEGAGFQVAEAMDGVEAVQLLTRDRYNLVLADLRLPKCKDTVLKAAKEADPFCRVIVMAGYGDIGGAARAVSTGGARNFVTKPIDPDRLLRIVRQTLAG